MQDSGESAPSLHVTILGLCSFFVFVFILLWAALNISLAVNSHRTITSLYLVYFTKTQAEELKI